MGAFDRRAVGIFAERYGSSRAEGLDLLLDLLARFSHLPYENLTKILAWDGGRRPPSPRLPLAVMEDHLRLGTGGTCFSLTELLRHIVCAAGLDSYPVMAHMRHGRDIHCALRVDVAGRSFLVDPGYLVRQPLPLGDGEPRRWSPGAAALVRAGELGGVPPGTPAGDFDLYTLEEDGPRWRYRFADRAPSPETFMHHWVRSFHLPGMRSLLVTTRDALGQHVYLHDHKLRSRTAAGRSTRNVRESLDATVEQVFGIDSQVAAAARRVLERMRAEGAGRGPLPRDNTARKADATGIREHGPDDTRWRSR